MPPVRIQVVRFNPQAGLTGTIWSGEENAVRTVVEQIAVCDLTRLTGIGGFVDYVEDGS